MIDFIHLHNFGGHCLNTSNGRQLNFLDYAMHLKDSVRICFLVDNPQSTKENYNLLRYFRDEKSIKALRNVPLFGVNFIDASYFLEERDTLLCDFATLYTLLKHGIEPKYDKIIIMDCVELTVFFRNIDIPTGIEQYQDSDSDDHIMVWIQDNWETCTFLITDYNYLDVLKYGLKHKIYYKKINFNLFDESYIQKIPVKDEMCYYYSKYNDTGFLQRIKEKYPGIILTDNFMDVWGYKTVLYTQKPYVGNIEQFGRMYFELQYYGREVIKDDMFKAEEKTGIDWYIEHYNGSIPNLADEDFLNEIQ